MSEPIPGKPKIHDLTQGGLPEPTGEFATQSDQPKTKTVLSSRARLANSKVKASELENKGEEDRQGREQADHDNFWNFRTSFGWFARLNVSIWQVCILVVVICQGAGLLQIDHTILLALITTTTINVFAFLIIVMKFVFANPSKAK